LLGRPSGRPYLAYVSRGNDFLTVLVDPATTRVLGQLPDRSLVRTVQELHFDLLGGRSYIHYGRWWSTPG